MEKKAFIIMLFLTSISNYCMSQGSIKNIHFPQDVYGNKKVEFIKKLNVKREIEITYKCGVRDTTKLIYYSKEGLVDSIFENPTLISVNIRNNFDWKTIYKYDENGNCIDTIAKHIFKPIKIKKGNNTLSYGDTLAITYDSLNIEKWQIITAYDLKNNLYDHYSVNNKTGLVGFRNISRFDKNGKLYQTTVLSRTSDSYVIQYYYNKNGQRVKELKIYYQNPLIYTKEYTYYRNGLLNTEVDQNMEIKHKYEYYK